MQQFQRLQPVLDYPVIRCPTPSCFSAHICPRLCGGGRLSSVKFRGDVVRVGGMSDAPIQWPRVLETGRPSLIVCGELVRAVKQESAAAVAHHWGVCETTVWKWRIALGVGRMTEGTTQLYRDLVPSRLPPEKAALGRERANTFEHAAAQSAARKGKPANEATRNRLLRAAKRKWSPKRKRERRILMKQLTRSGVVRPPQPPQGTSWSDKEKALLGMMLDRAVAEITGRSITAVRAYRKYLGIPMSRHSRLHQEPKPENGRKP